MRLIYHPEAEAELIEAECFYEWRVPLLGEQFLDAAAPSARQRARSPKVGMARR
jgi:hypothetical protein